jgi:hypothetical protein
VVRWIRIGAALVAVAIGVAVAVIATHWPFTQEGVRDSLQQNFGSAVAFQKFRVTYFPPGCVAENVMFRRNSDAGRAPIASVRRLTVEGSYLGFLAPRNWIPRVRVEGLRVFVSPETERAGKEVQSMARASDSKLVVGKIIADGAILEFSSREQGSAPLKFEVPELALEDVSDDRAMSYRVELTNPLPPGEIRAEGKFGPLRRNSPGQTAASGTYVFETAKLGVFSGIGGTLSSRGKFSGRLEQLQVAGDTDVPNFETDNGGHPVHLKTQFEAVVNGMNGDVALHKLTAQFGHTSVMSHVSIESVKGANGKLVTVTGTEQRGTIQDWLWLMGKPDHPKMSGPMTFQAKVRVPPGDRDFIYRVEVQGDFRIVNADFMREETQQQVDNLSRMAQGEKQEGDPPSVSEAVDGHVEMKDAVATFTDLHFEVPGAKAHLHGTYGILTQKIDLHGNLRVDQKLSKTQGGMKGIFVRIAEPFLRKKRQGEIVPVKVVGTYSHPAYGLDLMK